MATYEEESRFQKFKNTMKELTWKERLQHLWEYYKWFGIGALVIIAMIVSIVVSVTQNSKEMLYSGVCINLSMTDEGSAYVTDGWFAKLEGDQKKQQTELIPMALNSGANALTDIEMSSSEKLIAMITSGELDYMLMDASSLTYAGNNGMMAPLDEFLSQEMIAKFEGKIVTLQVDGKNYLAAIDISDLPFVKKHMGSTNKVYIGFPGNTSRSERNEACLQYLMDWTE